MLNLETSRSEHHPAATIGRAPSGRPVASRSGRWRAALIALAVSLALLGSDARPALAGGSAWCLIDAPEFDTLFSVAYGDGVWIAVGNPVFGSTDPVVLRSTDDAVTWTAVENPLTSSGASVAYGDGVWVVVSAVEVMRSTDDGLTWQRAEDGDGDPVPGASSVAYGTDGNGNGVWVAVSSSRILRSTDKGVTWTVTTPLRGIVGGIDIPIFWASVAYGDGVWVAVATSGTEPVMRSTNGGATWTAVTGTGSGWEAVAYGPDGSGGGVWVAVSNARVMRSTDKGVTWTVTDPSLAGFWNAVAHGNGVWIAAARGSGGLMRSTDGGATWTAVPGTSFRSVAYGDGVWIAGPTNTPPQVWRSTDSGEDVCPGGGDEDTGDGGSGGSGTGGGGGADAWSSTVASAVEAAAGLSGASGVLSRPGSVSSLAATVLPGAGSQGGLALTEEGLAVTLRSVGGASSTLGVVVPVGGELVVRIQGGLVPGSTVEGWVYAPGPRLVGAVRVPDDHAEGDFIDLVLPFGAPLDGAGAITGGTHTLQLRMTEPAGPAVVATVVTVGGPVPSGVSAGGGTFPAVPLLALLALVSSLIAAGMVVRLGRAGV